MITSDVRCNRVQAQKEKVRTGMRRAAGSGHFGGARYSNEEGHPASQLWPDSCKTFRLRTAQIAYMRLGRNSLAVFGLKGPQAQRDRLAFRLLTRGGRLKGEPVYVIDLEASLEASLAASLGASLSRRFSLVEHIKPLVKRLLTGAKPEKRKQTKN